MIQTLSTLKIVGPVTVSLVRVTDDKTGDVTEDYEVSCEHADCERYMCTHLTAIEALMETAEHAHSVHGIDEDDAYKLRGNTNE